MSFILDSLKRAENEHAHQLDRQVAEIPGPRSFSDDGVYRSRFRLTRISILALLILGVGAGLAAIYANRSPAPSVIPVSPISVVPMEGGQDAKTDSHDGLSTDRSIKQAPDPPKPSASGARPLRLEAKVKPLPAAETIAKQPVARPKSPPEPGNAEIESSAVPDRPADLFFDGQINIHSFSDDPAERFVYINFRRYHEGQQIGMDGPVIEKITTQGAILVDGGRKHYLKIKQ